MQKMSKVISAMSLLQQIGIIDLASSNIQMHISTHTRKFHAILTKCLQKKKLFFSKLFFFFSKEKKNYKAKDFIHELFSGGRYCVSCRSVGSGE